MEVGYELIYERVSQYCGYSKTNMREYYTYIAVVYYMDMLRGTMIKKTDGELSAVKMIEADDVTGLRESD